MEQLTKQQNKALLATGISALIFIAVMAVLVVPEGALLRNPETGAILPSPFMSGIVAIILLFFFLQFPLLMELRWEQSRNKMTFRNYW
ncbi:AbgT family transporter [Peribacillus frigoritolerans]|nr:AbgT family transporter [Peribacillus frigoritolerans]